MRKREKLPTTKLGRLEYASRKRGWAKAIGGGRRTQTAMRRAIERTGVMPPYSGLLSLYLYVEDGAREVSRVPDVDAVLEQLGLWP